ncbi:MAG: hypothetical protein ACRBB0_17715 [Pelagimonas sp.]|uniref:hypothetical protein n=1 Tax=Pelagimonas sp. TaxID=2073170 RepID=UPI003D6C12EF
MGEFQATTIDPLSGSFNAPKFIPDAHSGLAEDAIKLKGRHRLYLNVAGSGIVSGSNGESYFLSPQSSFGFSWDVDLGRGQVSKDVGLKLNDKEVEKLLQDGQKDNLPIESILAMPPLDGQIGIRYYAEPSVATLQRAGEDKQEIPVRVSVKKLSFKVHFASELRPMLNVNPTTK